MFRSFPESLYRFLHAIIDRNVFPPIQRTSLTFLALTLLELLTLLHVATGVGEAFSRYVIPLPPQDEVKRTNKLRENAEYLM